MTEGLALSEEDSTILAYRDTARDLEYLRRATDVRHQGLSLDLRGFQYVVLLNWREFRASADQPWDRLCDALNGQGVYSVEEALSKLRLRPLHEALGQAISFSNVQLFEQLAGKKDVKVVERVDKNSADLITANKKNRSRKQKVPTSESPFHLFLEESKICFERAAESLSAEERAAMQTLSAAAPLNKAAAGITKRASVMSANPEESFRNECEATAAAAVHLSNLKQNFSKGWPAALREILPVHENGVSSEQSWPPILAWIVLRSLPAQGIRVALFDRLHLRSALAEIFSSFGMEGEMPWRMAAYLRVLLLRVDQPFSGIDSEAFWNDPDVRWLADVHKASEETYFNREQFEELLSWIQVPALLEMARKNSRNLRAIKEIKEAVRKSSPRGRDRRL